MSVVGAAGGAGPARGKADAADLAPLSCMLINNAAGAAATASKQASASKYLACGAARRVRARIRAASTPKAAPTQRKCKIVQPAASHQRDSAKDKTCMTIDSPEHHFRSVGGSLESPRRPSAGPLPAAEDSPANMERIWRR